MLSLWSAAEIRFRPRAPSASHIIRTQHSTLLSTSRNGGLQDSSWGSVGPGGAVADCFTQLPLPAGFWGPGPSCFLSSPSQSRAGRNCPHCGGARSPHVPRSCQAGAAPQFSLLSVPSEGWKGRYSFRIPFLHVHLHHPLAFPTLKSESFILPGAVVELKAPGGSEGSHGGGVIIRKWGCGPSTLPNSGCPPDPHRVPAPCSSGWGGGPPFQRMSKKFPCAPSRCSVSRKELLEPVKPESQGAAWTQSLSEFSEPARRRVGKSPRAGSFSQAQSN